MAVQINDIDRQAAEWAAKSDGGLMAAADKAALETWLAADSRHLGAYTKACAVLVQIERMGAANALADHVLPHPAVQTWRRRAVLGGGVAAGLVALAFTAQVGWRALQQQTYATNAQQAAAAKQSQLKATQESAAEAAATPYTSSQNATALQPINATASLVAGATGANNNTTGFNSVLAKQKAASGFLGQQNSLNSTGARLGGS